MFVTALCLDLLGFSLVVFRFPGRVGELVHLGVPGQSKWNN